MDDKMKSLGFVKDWFFGWVRIIYVKELRYNLGLDVSKET